MNSFYIDGQKFFHWDDAPRLSYEESLAFIDHDYFSKKYRSLSRQFKTNKDKNSVVKDIVLTSGLSLEALFALLCSFLQAGYSYYMWINQYRNTSLPSVVEKINKMQFVKNHLGLEEISWHAISQYIFGKHPATFPLVERYAKIWQELASYFCEKERTTAYNRIKHGFTASSNAIKELTIGNDPEKITLQGSLYGSHYIVAEIIEGSNCNLISREQFVNHDVEYLLEVIRAVSFSIFTMKGIMSIYTDPDKKHEIKLKFLNKKYVENFLGRQRVGVVNVTLSKRVVNYPVDLPVRGKSDT